MQQWWGVDSLHNSNICPNPCGCMIYIMVPLENLFLYKSVLAQALLRYRQFTGCWCPVVSLPPVQRKTIIVVDVDESSLLRPSVITISSYVTCTHTSDWQLNYSSFILIMDTDFGEFFCTNFHVLFTIL